MPNYEICKACNDSEANYYLELRGFEDIAVCEDCGTKILNLKLVLLENKFYDYSKLSLKYQLEALRQNQIRLMKDVFGIKNYEDSDSVVNFTLKKTKQRFRKYTPLVREASKILKQEAAKKMMNSFKKQGEAGLTIINKYKDFCKFIKENGLTFYETMHIMDRIANPEFAKKIISDRKDGRKI